MDIKQLQLYLHLCDTLNFTRTAEQHHVTPSTLSRILQRLEQETGHSLFERDNRHVAITQAGLVFQQFAQQTLSQWQALQTKLDPKQQLIGTLNLYCSVTAAYSHLPQLLEAFRGKHPLVEIQLTTGDAANAVEEVLAGRADIAIAAQPDILPTRLYFQTLDHVPMQLCAPLMASNTQELLAEQPIPWHKIPFILPDKGPARRRCETWFKQMEITPNVYAKVSGNEAITSMVALGCGVSMVPQAVIEHSPIRQRLKLLQSPIAIAPLTLGCCCRKQQQHEPLIEAFLATLAS